jgi:hypothetical protein
MQLMLMQQHLHNCCIYQKQTLAAKETTMPFLGEVAAAVVAATARCTRVATSTEFKPELNNLLNRKRFLLEKFF